MKSHINIIVASLFVLLVVSSCKDDNVSFGTVGYYDSFLWSKSDIQPVTKLWEFDFSEDARNDTNCYAKFEFTDNNGVRIAPTEMQVWIDGELLKENTFSISSNDLHLKKEVKFTFSPNAKTGKHQGYLRLIQHNHLDRLDSQNLNQGEHIDVFQWNLNYDKSMNPLKKMLMWIMIAIGAILVVWFRVLRPIFYPHLGNSQKIVCIEKNNQIVGSIKCPFKGARKVVFSTRQQKQSFWNRLFLGEIRTVKHECFTSDIVFIPNPKGKGALAIGKEYSIWPNPIPKNGEAEITNAQQKLILKIR
jgi:hypothetical protein